jgi:hypothetical protein
VALRASHGHDYGCGHRLVSTTLDKVVGISPERISCLLRRAGRYSAGPPAAHLTGGTEAIALLASLTGRPFPRSMSPQVAAGLIHVLAAGSGGSGSTASSPSAAELRMVSPWKSKAHRGRIGGREAE